MRMLLSFPPEPICTTQVAEIAGFTDAWDLRKMGKIMSVLHGRSLVKKVGPKTYQITPLGLKIQARLKQQVYGTSLETEDQALGML